MCEDQVTNIEKLFPAAGPSFLLQMLFNCQKVAVKDKFFYDSLLARIEQVLPQIINSTDIMMLGVAVNMNADFKRDNMPFLLKFYEHAHKCRFLIKQEDKQVLSRIFSEMQLSKFYKKHLDMFADVKGKELQK